MLFVTLGLMPAFGQHLPSPVGPGVRLPGLFAGRTPEGNNPAKAFISSATPGWTPFFQFTPHTGLDAHSAVYDSATNVMIVFGGFDAGLAYRDTNAVLLRADANGSGNWSTLIANGIAGSPAPREAHTAVYDSTDNRMIVFSGCDRASFTSPCAVLSGVWVLTNANGQGGTPAWTKLSPTGTAPAPRIFHTAVYDSANNRMIIFGGSNATQLFYDVWVLSNANGLGGTPAWTRLSPNGGPPSNVAAASAVYDPNNNIMMVFGGITNITFTGFSNAVWTLSHANGLGGTPQWTNIVANGAAGSPARRALLAATYDAANNRMTIFGGEVSSAIGATNDVWVLAGANGLGGTPTWTRLTPAGIPPGTRAEHTAVYDAANNLMIIFAGENLDSQHYITWVLSDANGL
jgi:hypothetical protein